MLETNLDKAELLHKFNTHLSIILGYAQMLGTKFEESSVERNWIGKIETEAKNIESLVLKLKELIKKD